MGEAVGFGSCDDSYIKKLQKKQQQCSKSTFYSQSSSDEKARIKLSAKSPTQTDQSFLL